jgi:hypothetical protein
MTEVKFLHVHDFVCILIYVFRYFKSPSLISFADSFNESVSPNASYFFQLRFMLLKGKGKAVLLQACSGPEGSRKLRFLYFMKTVQAGGKVVSLRHRPPLSPGTTPSTRFC